MPNLDGGHYFLTVLTPVRTQILKGRIPGRSVSNKQRLMQKLSLLATGRQTKESPEDAWPSPFSRNTLNHTARFALIDQPHFNGRMAGDTLIDTVRGLDPLAHPEADSLGVPYLLFAADFDAQGLDADTALRRYTDELWRTMADDLTQIFSHCEGFDAADGAAAFHDYIKRCQVETTLPFNDYWANGMQAPPDAVPIAAVTLAAKLTAGLVVLWLVVVLLLDPLARLFRLDGLIPRALDRVAAWGLPVVLVVVALFALYVFVVYRQVLARGAQPFATAPNSDLPSVLKALYLQQNFVRFATEAQGLDDAGLHARFGAFLKAVRLGEPTPAMAAGECHADHAEWTA
jgi:hypothetical protein